MPDGVGESGLLPIRSRTDRARHLAKVTVLPANGSARDARRRHARHALGAPCARCRGRLPVSTGRARLPPIGLIAFVTEVGEIPSRSEPLTPARPAEVLQLRGAALVVPDDLVEIEDVYLAGIELSEAIADVVEEKTQLLVVISGDHLPGRPPLRLLLTGVELVISCHRAER